MFDNLDILPIDTATITVLVDPAQIETDAIDRDWFAGGNTFTVVSYDKDPMHFPTMNDQ